MGEAKRTRRKSGARTRAIAAPRPAVPAVIRATFCVIVNEIQEYCRDNKVRRVVKSFMLPMEEDHRPPAEPQTKIPVVQQREFLTLRNFDLFHCGIIDIESPLSLRINEFHSISLHMFTVP